MPEHVTLSDLWLLMHSHIQEEAVFRTNISRAFPKNKRGEVDWDGHGEYHERLIDRAIKAEERRERLLEKFIGGSLWAAVVVIAGWIGTGALAWLREHLIK